MANWYSDLGEIDKAGECLAQTRKLERSSDTTYAQAVYHEALSTVLLAEGKFDEAVDALRLSAAAYGDDRQAASTVWARLGHAYLAIDRPAEAIDSFLAAEALLDSCNHSEWEYLLAGLEEAYDGARHFREFCDRCRAEYPEAASRLNQWYLTMSELRDFGGTACKDGLATSLGLDWTWHDPFGDCAFVIGESLEIQASNGRALQHTNQSAPRVLRSVNRDFAAQVACAPAREDRPAIGGLLIWKGPDDYPCLVKGSCGKQDVAFRGRIGGQETLAGRGRLMADRVFLRVESDGGRVRALCSPEGEQWYTVGETAFPKTYPFEVGLCASGLPAWYGRTIYRDVFPEGTAMRFECFVSQLAQG